MPSSRPEPAASCARSPAVGGGRTRFRPCPDSCLTAQPAAGADGARAAAQPQGGIRRRDFWKLQSHPEPVTLLYDLWYLRAWTRQNAFRQERR